jgi:S-adenosylmethionine synthetase
VNTLVDAVWKAQDPNAGLKMDDWAQRYPTNTEDVARVCRDIAVKYLSEKDQVTSLPKKLQFSSEDRMTKYEICETLAEILGVPLPGMTRNRQGNDPSATVQRPFDTHLSTQALKDLGIEVHTQDFKSWW